MKKKTQLVKKVVKKAVKKKVKKPSLEARVALLEGKVAALMPVEVVPGSSNQVRLEDALVEGKVSAAEQLGEHGKK
jgi:hypothetical protein